MERIDRPCALRPRPKPDDFDQVCLELSVVELAAHYSAGNKVVARWLSSVPFRLIAERRLNMIERFENSRNYEPGKRGWQRRLATLSEMG